MPSDRILILGGTRDGREIAEVLVASGRNIITSLAGATQQPLLPSGALRFGGFGGVEGLKSYLKNEGIRLVVDATHPFAAQMSSHAFEACGAGEVLLLRFERQPWTAGEGDQWTNVGSAMEAASVLPSGAHVLLTTGRKDLKPFFARSDLSGIARMIEQPAAEPPGNWLVHRDRPPFTVESEVRLMAENGITHLVTKNAGGSATEAKLVAARERGVEVVMIARPTKPDVPVFASIGHLIVAVEGVLSP